MYSEGTVPTRSTAAAALRSRLRRGAARRRGGRATATGDRTSSATPTDAPELSLPGSASATTGAARAVPPSRSRACLWEDLDDVLADPDDRGGGVATPPAHPLQLVRAALEAGKHVLVEKPLARRPPTRPRADRARRASSASC